MASKKVRVWAGVCATRRSTFAAGRTATPADADLLILARHAVRALPQVYIVYYCERSRRGQPQNASSVASWLARRCAACQPCAVVPASASLICPLPACALPPAMYGHVARMAQAVKQGVDSVEGVEGVLYQVGARSAPGVRPACAASLLRVWLR